MNIDALLMRAHDEIDFTSLAAATLHGLATQTSEPYIATSALAELGARRGTEARAAASAVLSAKPWDRHLLAFAITILFDIDCDSAITEMARLLDQASDSKVLGAMMECVLSNPDRFGSGPSHAFVGMLAKKVEVIEPDQFSDIDERAAFLARYRN